MGDHVLRIYHRLPTPLRSLAASLHGSRLRAWRYGPETDRLVEEALERERWTPAQWQAWRQERLSCLLHRAAICVPYYRAQWEARRRRGDRSSWEDLGNWPLLDKEDVRRSSAAFIADDRDRRRLRADFTSGTTGTPLTVWWDRAATQHWYALGEARWRGWYGVTRRDRWAILGGRVVVPVRQDTPPFWVWNAGLNQLYMSVYHLSPPHIPAYLAALPRYGIRYMLGYTSALYALAQEALRIGWRDARMRVVITNAEPVFDGQRQAIEAAFGCAVRETYGMSEAVAAAGECECARLHLWPEAGVVEVMESAVPCPHGVTGELVCTGLLNAAMPLIRYRVGDRGALADPLEQCACGRTLPMLRRLEGRSSDVLYTRDGRRIGLLTVLQADLPIRETQIIQETWDTLRVLYVPAEGASRRVEEVIAQRLRERLGDLAIRFEAVKEVPRTPGGKFRAVICRLTEAEKEAAVGNARDSD